MLDLTAGLIAEFSMACETRKLDVEALIDSSWKRGTDIPDVGRSGVTMSTIIEVADGENQSNLPPTVRNWLVVYDEIGAWCVNLAMLITSTAMDDPLPTTSFQASLICVAGIISAQVIATRRLIMCGLDVQAKQLLRVLTEQIDVAVALSVDPQLAEEFALTLDGDTANNFWHRHVKKGKLRKALFARLEMTMGSRLATELLKFIDQEEKILGMGIHPSMAAAQMACLPETGRPGEAFYFGFFGKQTIFSQRTLSYAIQYLTLYVAVGFVPEEREIDHTSPAGQLIGPIQQHVLQGRAAVLRLVAGLIPNWHHPDLNCDLDALFATRSATDE